MRYGRIAAPIMLLAMAAGDVPMQPGRWAESYQILSVGVPGRPASSGRALGRTGMARTMLVCISPSQAAAGPRAALAGVDGRCHFTRYDIGGGTLDALLACKGGMTVTTHGSFTPTAFDLISISTTRGKKPMTMRSRTTGRLVGPC